MKQYLIIILVFFVTFTSKRVFCVDKQQFEIGAGAGVSNYFGDIGSNLNTFKPAFQLSGRYFFNSRASVSLQTTYANFYGHDKYANPSRGYSFTSNLYESSVLLELYVFHEGSKFKYYSSYQGTGGKKFNIFLMVGFGAMHFNAQAYVDGIETDLSNMYYKNTNYTFPIGGGVKYTINKKLAVNLTIAERITPTDYLDDFSSPTGENDFYLVGVFSLFYKIFK